MHEEDLGRLDRAALERIAFGPDGDAVGVAAARTELARRGDGAGPAPAQPVPADGLEARQASGRQPSVADAPVLTTKADPRDPAPGLQADASSAGPAAAPPSAPPATLRRRRWRIGALVAVTAVLAGALGVTGTIVAGRIGPPVVEDGSSDSGSETLTRVLARDQTAEDDLPTAITASVDRSSARLLFANYADRPPVPWVVWVARARTSGEVCFIASPDRYASDVTCVPSAQALHGQLSYVTRDGDQGLAIRVVGGVARIDLIGGE